MGVSLYGGLQIRGIDVNSIYFYEFIFLDMLNPKGLKFFWPCGVSIRVPIISKYLPQDGVFDRFFGGGLYFCNVYLFVCLIMHQPAAELLMEAGAHIAAGLSFW